MSKIEVDKVDPQSGTTLTLGTSGDTIAIPSGVTIANSGTATGFSTAGIVSNADATAITITDAELVQIKNTNDTGGLLSVSGGDSGATANTGHDEIVVENSGNSGVSILSGTSSNGAVCFGDSDNNCIGYVNYDHTNNKIDLGTNGATQWSLDSSGNFLPAATDHGIYLGVNSATAANLLDDYEEGTWEATVTTGSGSITVNSSNNLCNYTKIGRMVQLNGSLSISSVSSPSGDLLINGKPFATTGGEGGFRATGAFCMYNPTNGTPPGLVCQIFEGYDPLRIESSGSADRSQADHVQASSELRFTINYVTHL
jgi:hypothetical protein